MSTIEIEREVEIESLNEDEDSILITLRVEVEISGRYYPETWGYDGGTPAEYPEAEIVSVSWQPEGRVWVEVPFAWWPLSEREIEGIEAEALEAAEKDYDGPDYDGDDDRYDYDCDDRDHYHYP